MRTVILGFVSLAALFLATACGEVVAGFTDARDVDAGEIDAPAAEARLTIDRDTADFGMLVVGTASTPESFTITNRGNAATGALTTAVTGDGFRSTGDTCRGQILQPQDACTVAVTATLTAPGPASGAVMVSGNPGGSVSASLSASGLVPGALTLMPPNHDFGDIVAGQMSAPFDFEIRNTGGAPTGNVGVMLGGADPGDFEIAASTCSGMPLAAGARCTVSVRMKPGATTGARTATLIAMAAPGGAAMSTLMGNAVRPAIIVFGGMNGDFGSVPLGMAPTRTITVTNNGQQATGALTITRMGANEFQILAGVAGDCATGMTMLAGGASCNLRVRFSPTASGPVMGTITVAGMPGGTINAALSGRGERPATLSSPTNSGAFGQVEVNTVSMGSTLWTIMNSGDVASSVPVLTAGAELDITNNTCNAAIAAGASCSMTVRFKPSTGGARVATATVAVTGSMVSLTATATGVWRVTVNRSGGGTITSVPMGISCAAPALQCSALFVPGNVTLQARTTNGSGAYFAAWSGASAGTCAGTPLRDCVVNVDGVETLTGTFNTITANLAFVSSASFATNLGGVAPYDTACNTLATSAGINNLAGNNYIAWISTANSPAPSRLGAAAVASGWVRMDGRVFASSYNALVTSVILNPLRYTELGTDVPDFAFILTGTSADGSASTSDCSAWTSNNAGVVVTMGITWTGGISWTAGAGAGCTIGNQRIMCMMKQFNQGTGATAFAGKKLWLTNSAYAPSANGNPDTSCNADRPAGVASGRALISRTTQAGSNLLVANQMYVRPDGQEVGTGAEIAAGAGRGGIWQLGNGTYTPSTMRVWTGSISMDQVGTVAQTCGNWIDSSQATGIVGYAEYARRSYWQLTNQSCNVLGGTSARLYCYEP